jgi:hypothetical protein
VQPPFVVHACIFVVYPSVCGRAAKAQDRILHSRTTIVSVGSVSLAWRLLERVRFARVFQRDEARLFRIFGGVPV